MKTQKMLRCAGTGLLLLLTIVVSGCGSSDADFEYVAIGASDATGIGASPLTNGYVFQIEKGLDDNCGDTELYNLGIPSAEADEIEDIEVPLATEIDPDIITIFTGANDLVGGRTLEAFQNDFMDIVQTLSEETDARLFVATLPDLTKLPEFTEDPDADVTAERVQAFNNVIINETAAVNATLVDLREVVLSDVLVSDDGFHPSDEGHLTIANLFLDQMLPVICPGMPDAMN